MDPATTPKKDSSEFSQVTMSPTSLNEMENKMRNEIRKLQDKKVAVLTDEIMQLQNEKETLLSKINSFENENKKLKEENDTLKTTAKPSVQITVLERALQQEKDEKDKLKQRLKVIKKRNSGLTIDTNLDRERSSSMNDMARQDSMDTTSIKDADLIRLKRLETKVNTSSPKTKRYVLAATSTKDASTQTLTYSEINHEVATAKDAENDEDKKTMAILNEDMKVALSEAKSTILEILQEKEIIETQLAKEEAISSVLRQNLQGSKELEKECALLKNNLKQFHQWVNAKLRSVQEEMDICKVIYSLHGSLSQEATLIEQLTEKVQEQKRFIIKLQSDNSNLEMKLVSTQKDLNNLKLKQSCRSSGHQAFDAPQLVYSNQLQQHIVIMNAAESPVV